MHFPDDVPTLVEGDVTLRAHHLNDVDGIVEQCTDPTSVRWTSVPVGYTAEMAQSWVEEAIPTGWASGEELTFAIESTHPDGRRRFSGSLSLRDEGSRRAEIAYGAHPAVRGRGMMKTAVGLLLDWGFGARDLETVLWLSERGNLGSRRVAWRSGFTFGGVVPRWLDHRNLYPDAWIGALHRDDPREPTSRWYDVPVLTGDHVVLRPQRDDDAERIVEGRNDPTTAYWLPFLLSPYTDQDATTYIEDGREAAARGERLQWALADPVTDRLVGVIGLPQSSRYGTEVGYWTHRSARGSGLMTEALGLVIAHAFADAADAGLGAERLFIRSAVDNIGSQRVAERSGFTRFGTERGSMEIGGGRRTDAAVFDLLRDEWRTMDALP